ncbi:uncharacterized protein LOC103571217 [Microplitis demolitor]|uniref:uncharacterized protein LOC103571217 n=1 Tax=Microplitis demolitor TaxID=69319 RepID=UPI0004CCA63D|nr:uncharacterized protein LOC103571217 [Microplitis demolitor]
MNMELNEDDWYVDCSDEEKYDVISKDDWYLKPDSLLNMINKMEHNKQCLDLEWKCPGRRGPSPIPLNSHQPDHELSDYKIEEKDNFDFMDEMSSPRLPVRRVGEATPKGSAKKKTASFNGALSTIIRHRRQEQQEISLSPKKIDPNSITQNIKLHPS